MLADIADLAVFNAIMRRSFRDRGQHAARCRLDWPKNFRVEIEAIAVMQ